MSTPRILALLAAITLAAAIPLKAQTAQQLQALRNNPQLVRQQIQQSGLTPDQIRERLRQGGYSPSLLDAFLESEQAELSVGDDVLSALSVLGVGEVEVEGLVPLPVITEPTVARAAQTETGLSLFGLNVFRTPTSQFQPILSGPVPSNYRL